jgi:putative toxin-antitoxin system antitoxin component (TIGR02293 family)
MKTREKYAKLLEEGWEAGSGNVFADLGLPGADELQAKTYLRAAILARIEALGISQTEAARRTQLTQPKISNLLKGTSPIGFSSDKLIEVARKLGLDVELRVNAAAATPGISFLRAPASFRMDIIGAADTIAARRKIVSGGVPGTALRTARERLGLATADIARVLGVTERTASRKERQRAPLTSAEADRLYRLARVADAAVMLIGNERKATSWLRTPNAHLAGETPVSMLDTDIGAELIVESLHAVAHGGAA